MQIEAFGSEPENCGLGTFEIVPPTRAATGTLLYCPEKGGRLFFSMASRSSRIVLVIVVVVGLLAGTAFYRSYQRSIRVVRVVKVERQDLHTGVVTNGKAEPISFREVHAELEGEVTELGVQQGDVVKQGQKLLALGPGQVTSELEQARAELAEAESTLRLLQQGGTTAQVDELRSQLDAARRERDQAAEQVQQNERLVEHGAIARVELEQSRLRLTKAESDLALLQDKWDKRSDPIEVARAEARVAAVRAALSLAESRRRASTIVSPLGGTVYSVAVRIGDHVNRGDLLARVGELDRIRVRVFVDEPDFISLTTQATEMRSRGAHGGSGAPCRAALGVGGGDGARRRGGGVGGCRHAGPVPEGDALVSGERPAPACMALPHGSL